MQQARVEKFQGSQELLLFGIPLTIIGIVFSLWGQDIDSNVIKGLGLFLVGLILVCLAGLFTSTTIVDSKTLVSKVFLARGFKADIHKITKIDRTSVFVFKHWGSRLQIYHADESGQETWHTIQESMYSVETIKKLLKRLKEINPSIELHKQYQDLIDGKIENEKSFKRLPIK